MALAVGFGGVLLVASPGVDSFGVGALFAVANAVLFGSVTTVVRGMSRTESAETLTMYQMSLHDPVLRPGNAGVRFHDADRPRHHALVAVGILNGIGQYWWTRALSMAPPSAIGPFYYFALVWAIVLGYLFWGDIPTLSLLAGSCIVVGVRAVSALARKRQARFAGRLIFCTEHP